MTHMFTDTFIVPLRPVLKFCFDFIKLRFSRTKHEQIQYSANTETSKDRLFLFPLTSIF